MERRRKGLLPSPLQFLAWYTCISRAVIGAARNGSGPRLQASRSLDLWLQLRHQQHKARTLPLDRSVSSHSLCKHQLKPAIPCLVSKTRHPCEFHTSVAVSGEPVNIVVHTL